MEYYDELEQNQVNEPTTDKFSQAFSKYNMNVDSAWVKSVIEKAKKEFAHLRQRSSGPEGKQYALIATADGWYENVRGGVVFLNKGDVWKYGETTREDRYSAKELDDKCLYQKTEFVGTQQQAKRQEKVKIYRYFFRHGTLPPGNRIFR